MILCLSYTSLTYGHKNNNNRKSEALQNVFFFNVTNSNNSTPETYY